MKDQSEQIGIWFEQLQGEGCRLTRARKVVIQTIISSRRASTPQQIFEMARKKYPAIGLVTVYRTVEKLEKLGLIRRVHQETGCNAYLPEEQGHNHLVICENCGKAEYFEGDDLLPLFRRVNEANGFWVKNHWLQLTGICSDCQKGLPAISMSGIGNQR